MPNLVKPQLATNGLFISSERWGCSRYRSPKQTVPNGTLGFNGPIDELQANCSKWTTGAQAPYCGDLSRLFQLEHFEPRRLIDVPTLTVPAGTLGEICMFNEMGFTESDVFVAPSLVSIHLLKDGQRVSGTAVLSFNKKRGNWGWRAVSIANV